jgi:hypothetical protein
MDIPVLLEPTPTGWRASTGAPLNLVAEGTDKDGLLADLRDQILRRYIAGARIETFSIPECDPRLDIVAKMALDMETLEQWAQAVREVREEKDALERAEEQPNGDLNGRHSESPVPSTLP